ncbi:MAG: hypothetical protein M3Q10_18935, partial [Chloroflexota bacterium]|nr:hypothetical protein [Chloroflexota bacterium]
MRRVFASLAGSALGVAVLAGAGSAQETTSPVVVDPSAPPASILITTVDGSDVYTAGGETADGAGGNVSLGDITVGPGTTLI